jgi:hypothetical protein
MVDTALGDTRMGGDLVQIYPVDAGFGEEGEGGGGQFFGHGRGGECGKHGEAFQERCSRCRNSPARPRSSRAAVADSGTTTRYTSPFVVMSIA